ncbi:MAG: response regulator transcription factor [Traorella sp.]
MEKILIIEDDIDLVKTLKEALITKGYDFRTCINMKQGLIEIESPFDCYLIDIRLPDGSGFEICEKIREKTHSPILLISSLEDEETILKGYQLQINDYIVKPFRLNVLLSKIQGIIQKKKIIENEIKYLDYIINPKELCLIHNQENIKLTNSELCILKVLFLNYPSIVSRERLLNSLWSNNGKESSDESLTVRISILNKKLKKTCTFSIKSNYGLGYSLKEE